MPYKWQLQKVAPSDDTPGETRIMHLWPHSALPRQGFAIFIIATAGIIAMPLIATLGSPVFWGLLPFIFLSVTALWWALRKSQKDRRVLEILAIGAEEASLTRYDSDGTHHAWRTNTYWVRPTLYKTGGPVPSYITLKGGPREVEIGAFLAEDERKSLYDELRGIFHLRE